MVSCRFAETQVNESTINLELEEILENHWETRTLKNISFAKGQVNNSTLDIAHILFFWSLMDSQKPKSMNQQTQ